MQNLAVASLRALGKYAQPSIVLYGCPNMPKVERGSDKCLHAVILCPWSLLAHRSPQSHDKHEHQKPHRQFEASFPVHAESLRDRRAISTAARRSRASLDAVSKQHCTLCFAESNLF